MESAEHLARALSLQTRGIQVLLWESKTDLLRALLVLQAALPEFPEAPTVLPTEWKELQRFSIGLFDAPESETTRRILLIPQARMQAVGAWLNGWRSKLADPPGTLLVIRGADFAALCRLAPDMISFAQSEIHEATGLLPLIEEGTLKGMSERLPDAWYEPLSSLPGTMPSKDEIAGWIGRLQSHLE